MSALVVLRWQPAKKRGGDELVVQRMDDDHELAESVSFGPGELVDAIGAFTRGVRKAGGPTLSPDGGAEEVDSKAINTLRSELQTAIGLAGEAAEHVPEELRERLADWVEHVAALLE